MIGGRTLKLVVAWSHRRNLCDIIRDKLLQIASEGDLRTLCDDSLTVWTAHTTSAVRDLLREGLDEAEGLLVVEFETWSGYGRALDERWLLSHGH
jgi:hypothetical protein